LVSTLLPSPRATAPPIDLVLLTVSLPPPAVTLPPCGILISDNFEQVEDVDGRFSGAVRQLRAQQQLIAAMNRESRNVEALLPPLSGALRHYLEGVAPRSN
jgi:hypothetical protein